MHPNKHKSFLSQLSANTLRKLEEDKEALLHLHLRSHIISTIEFRLHFVTTGRLRVQLAIADKVKNR